MDTRVGTTSSKAGDPVEARVVREVPWPAVNGKVAVPLEARLCGAVEEVFIPPTPVKRARLRIRFSELVLPDGSRFEVRGRVVEVENARETILEDGTIEGILASELPLTYLEAALERIKVSDAELGDEAERRKEQEFGAPETAIELPAGTDLQWALEEPQELKARFDAAAKQTFREGVGESVARLFESAPRRAVSREGKPGDPVNLVFIGSADDIRAAFRAAGWTEADPQTPKSVWETVRAVITGRGYSAAPMMPLLLYGRVEDLSFQKMFNTFARRHHLRLWRSPAPIDDGREIWLAAATHDVDWDVRPGVVSHAIDPEIDKEREKVAADLIASGAVSATTLVAPPKPFSSGTTATGSPWQTDGMVRAVELRSR
jgi:hypothetical protein